MGLLREGYHEFRFPLTKGGLEVLGLRVTGLGARVLPSTPSSGDNKVEVTKPGRVPGQMFEGIG